MDLDYTPEQRVLQETIRRFGRKVIAPRAAEYSRSGLLPQDIIGQLREMDLLGGLIPPEYGGAGMDHLSWVITIEELSRFDPIFGAYAGAPSSLLGQGLLNWGSEEQKQKYLATMMRGQSLGACAISEPNIGTDVGAMETTARKVGGDYVLNGTKLWISGGATADWIMVFASLDRALKHKGITAFIVEKGAPGLSLSVLENLLSAEMFPPAEVVFKDCVVPERNRLGAEGQGFEILSRCLDVGRLHVAARALGMCQLCLEACLAYANERKTFGQLIGTYQLIKSMITDMVVGIEAGRFLVYRAAQLRDKGVKRTQRETSIAKMFLADLAMKTTTDAIQIHGAYGTADEYRMSSLFRWAKIHQIVEGTSQLHRLIIADYALGYRK